MSVSTTLEAAIDITAESIHQQLENNLPADIKKRVEEWCELHGLERLDEPLRIVARQSAFNILLKATLYEYYHQRDVLLALNDDVREAFRKAKQTTGDAAFDEYILDEVAWLVDSEDFQEVLESRYKLVEAKEPSEEIGRLFEALTPQESRRKLGQFRTPISISDLMAEWLITDGAETVLDSGMGACALSGAVYRKKQQEDGQTDLSDIYGIDLNELALVMGATALTLSDNGDSHNLQTGDFLNVEVTDIDDTIDAVISNPPYSRHHALSEEYKAQVNKQAETELGREVSALSPMYAYFYYHAGQFLSSGGRMSFITPSEFLETNYGTSLKQFLVEEFDITALVLFDRDDDSKFDEALTTSLVSFLEYNNSCSDNLTHFIRVDENPSNDELRAAREGEVEGETDWGFVNTIRQEYLIPEDKWTGLFNPADIDTSGLTPLSALATVNRGIATGKNSYFCLTQNEVNEWNIDKQSLSKIVRNSRSVPGYNYTHEDWKSEQDNGHEVWLLYYLEELDIDNPNQVLPNESVENKTLYAYTVADANGADTDLSGLVKYLKHGMSDDVEAHDGYLARNRSPWYVVDRRDSPPILVTYMSRNGTRFIRNETNARNLSNLHGIYMNVALSEDQMNALLAYLNSEFASEVVRRSGRTYSSGMDKIEPNELEEVPVLDPRELDNATVSDLSKLFDNLCEAGRTENQSVKRIISAIDEQLETELQLE